jgi:hypothetical protein
MVCATALSLATASGAGSVAQAGYLVTLEQQGNTVVASGSGTLNLASLTHAAMTITDLAGIFPYNGSIITGPASGANVDFYTGFTGPASFGAGFGGSANSGSGDDVGIARLPGVVWLFVPSGYVSGNSVSDSATYDNQTFANLGATPGTYVWSWGSGADADTFTLDIVAPAVPEPSSLLLMALPLGLLALAFRVRPTSTALYRR